MGAVLPLAYVVTVDVGRFVGWGILYRSLICVQLCAWLEKGSKFLLTPIPQTYLIASLAHKRKNALAFCFLLMSRKTCMLPYGTHEVFPTSSRLSVASNEV